MQILSVRQPWASAIFERGKDIENRRWSTPYRGTLLIQAAKTLDSSMLQSAEFERGLLRGFEPAHAKLGVILGFVHLVDIVRDSDSPWARPDCFHWKLAGAFAFDEPLACKGKQGLWDADSAIQTYVQKSADEHWKKMRDNQPER